jgi:hypothetical protein
MVIDDSIASLDEYIQLKKELLDGDYQPGGVKVRKRHRLLVPERPRQCVECLKSDCFWVHSYWYRWAIEGDRETVVPVPRFECCFCQKLVSVLYGFLVPYRQFTVRAVAGGVENYVMEETRYRKVAGELSGENYRPAHSQVWQWAHLFVSKVQEFLGIKLQRACVELGKDEMQMMKAGARVCPNAENAGSPEKSGKLHFAARALGLAQLLLKQESDLIEALQTHFAADVQTPSSTLTGRGIRLLTPQSLKHAF